MRATQWRWVAALAVLAGVAPFAAAALRSLTKDELDTRSSLIVTGTVTEARTTLAEIGEIRTVYVCEFKVRVTKVEKGTHDLAEPLTVVGHEYVLHPGYTGDTGDRSDNTNDGVYEVAPGWQVTFYLSRSEDGTHRILHPNGFRVLSVPPGQSRRPAPPYRWTLSEYLY